MAAPDILVSAILTPARYEVQDESKTQYSDAELIAYVNEAIRRIIERVCRDWPDYWPNSGQNYVATSNIVANTANYDLPSDFYLLLNVFLTDSDGDVAELEPINILRHIDSDEDDGYLLRNNDIYLYPTPDTSVTNGLAIWYVALPTLITAITDSCPLSRHFRDAIQEWVVLKCKARQGEDTSEYASFYRLVEQGASAVVEQTNRSRTRHGLNVGWRDYV